MKELEKFLEEFFEADKVVFKKNSLQIHWRAYREGFKEHHSLNISRGENLIEVLPSIQQGMQLGEELDRLVEALKKEEEEVEE